MSDDDLQSAFLVYNVTCHQILICLGLESLELRRLRVDLLLVSKIIFGLRHILNLRGHPYQLFMMSLESLYVTPFR